MYLWRSSIRIVDGGKRRKRTLSLVAVWSWRVKYTEYEYESQSMNIYEIIAIEYNWVGLMLVVWQQRLHNNNNTQSTTGCICDGRPFA